jgi:hypothetical protein
LVTVLPFTVMETVAMSLLPCHKFSDDLSPVKVRIRPVGTHDDGG